MGCFKLGPFDLTQNKRLLYFSHFKCTRLNMAILNTGPTPTPLQRHSSLERLAEISIDQDADGFENKD